MDNVKSQESDGSMGTQKSPGYGVKSTYVGVDAGSQPYDNIVDFEEYSRYIEDRVRQLESRNDVLREQCSKIERDKRSIETQKIKYEREVRSLQSEIDKLKASPNLLGTVESVIGNGKVAVKASNGASFLVSSSQLIPEDAMKIGAQVALNMHTLAILEVVPKADDPYVAAFEVESDTNISYDDIGGLHDQIRDIREIIELPLAKPELFTKVGIKPPKGVLLFGPPG
ncbi:MAG: proteasome-activating nucleotidase, partial [Methanosarcinales archaeon]|nr:proteasome-activating nucleotidase [Methanosarcinales archaeon]